MTLDGHSRHDARLRLSRWETRGQGKQRHGLQVVVDWRGALTDALLDVNVDSGKVLAEFERLCLNPAYAVESDD